MKQLFGFLHLAMMYSSVCLLLICSNLATAETNQTKHTQLKLAQPVTNNAVAKAEVNNQVILYSFAGLHPEKNYKAVSAKAFAVNLSTGESKEIKGLPDGKGRLASIAVTVKNKIYLFGGYTVAADHSEISTPEVYQFNPDTNQYKVVSQMPTPVDDSIAVVYKNRYIYLVSGWHNTNNVDRVQVYDTQLNQWFSATQYPGNPVFGHAGGIVGNKILVVDGVKVLGKVDGKNQYAASAQNWLGEIDPTNPAKITWRAIKKHPYPPLYRMAAVGFAEQNMIVFAGGSDNPYNFNGIGYDGNPSQPSARVFGYRLDTQQWESFSPLPAASMDHRGLIRHGNEFLIAGGMLATQAVTDTIQSFTLSSKARKQESVNDTN